MNARTKCSRVVGVIAALPFAALSLAACSSGGGGADAATAKAALVRSSDLPQGWVQGKVSKGNDAQTAALAAKIPACADYAAQAKADKRQDVRAYSPTFSSSAGTTASTSPNTVANQVIGYASASDAKQAFEVYASSAGEECMRRIFAKVANQAAEQVTAQANGMSIKVSSTLKRLGVPPVGDANGAFGISLVIGINGKAVQQVGFTYEIVRSGPYVVSYNATLYRQMPKHWGTRMVDSSIARLEAAAGTGSAT